MIYLKKLKNIADEIDKLRQHEIPKYEWIKQKVVRKRSCLFFTYVVSQLYQIRSQFSWMVVAIWHAKPDLFRFNLKTLQCL